MKGQMFILGAILVVIALIMFRNFLSVYSTAEEGRYLDSALEGKMMRNLEKEYKFMAAISSDAQAPNASAARYMSNFSGMISDDGARVLYVFVYSPGNMTYSVLAGNYLGEKINFTALGSSRIIQNNANESFHFTTPIHANISVNLTYFSSSLNETETFGFALSARNTTAAFFDISLERSGIKLRNKILFNRTW